MTITEHYSVVRWHDGAAWIDVSADVGTCALTLTRTTREIYTLGSAEGLLAQGGRAIRLTLAVARETTAGFYRALLDAEASGAALTLELYQPDMTGGSRKASGAFLIAQVAPLGGDAGDGAAGMAAVVLVGGRGFTQGSA
jgi:hypothetical protein